MKKNKIIYLIFLIAICLTLFVSCEEEETFDCPEIEANIGDPCENPNGVEGTISEDCECLHVDGPDFDCPELEANFGDECFVDDGGNGTVGIISEDCECVLDGPDFDCPEIEANIGDPCENPNGVEGFISEDCECLHVDGPDFDCPDLEANFGDECFVDDGGNGTVGILSEDCECVVDGPGFDCEILEANIGDVCEAEFDFILFPGAVNEDCECELPDQQGGNCDMGLEVLDTNGEFNYTFSFAQLPESTTDHAWYIDGLFQGYNLGNELNYTFNSSGSHTIKVKAYLNSVDQSVFMTLCYNSIEIDL